MKWSWRIGQVAGIGIYVHATLIALLAWVGLHGVLQGGHIVDALRGPLFMVTLFGIIVLHELGHALTARRFGIRTRDITLLPIGGLARLERIPEAPWQELLVALAGPAVNLVLAVTVFLGLATLEQLPALHAVALAIGPFLATVLWVNVALGVFNLVPAFPMDGGRVLRALLALRLDYVRATRIAAVVGQALALALGLLGVFANPMLLFIGRKRP